MKTLASLLGIIGAILLALNIGYNYEAYIIFFISSVLWSLVAFVTHDKPLLYMNIVFVIINIIGVLSYGN